MRIFEEGGPLDPEETPEPPPPSPELEAPEAAPARGRSIGVFVLVLLDLALAGAAVGAVFFLAGARSYLLTDSSDFGTEMDDAMRGLSFLSRAGWVLAGGFLLSALGTLTLSRIGYRLQALWAVLLCLTIAGAAYGIPVLVFLRRRDTRDRFFS
jgi:hypothetical protein